MKKIKTIVDYAQIIQYLIEMNQEIRRQLVKLDLRLISFLALPDHSLKWYDFQLIGLGRPEQSFITEVDLQY